MRLHVEIMILSECDVLLVYHQVFRLAIGAGKLARSIHLVLNRLQIL